MVRIGRLKSGTMEVNNCSIVLTLDILLIYSVQNLCPRPEMMLWFLVQVMQRYVGTYCRCLWDWGFTLS